jgi:hypothetical protein
MEVNGQLHYPTALQWNEKLLGCSVRLATGVDRLCKKRIPVPAVKARNRLRNYA